MLADVALNIAVLLQAPSPPTEQADVHSRITPDDLQKCVSYMRETDEQVRNLKTVRGLETENQLLRHNLGGESVQGGRPTVAKARHKKMIDLRGSGLTITMLGRLCHYRIPICQFSRLPSYQSLD